MPVETFRGYIATLVAAVCVIGGGIAAIWAWQLAPIDPPRELSIIMGVIGGLIGTGTTFLLLQDSSSRASHATERAIGQGVSAGAALPAQAPVAPEPPPAPEPEPDIVGAHPEPDI